MTPSEITCDKCKSFDGPLLACQNPEPGTPCEGKRDGKEIEPERKETVTNLHEMVAQNPKMIQLGDTVRVKVDEGLTEDWLVAYADYIDGYLSAWGWPESRIEINKCELIKKATPEAYAEWGIKVSERDDRRSQVARRIYVRDQAA